MEAIAWAEVAVATIFAFLLTARNGVVYGTSWSLGLDGEDCIALAKLGVTTAAIHILYKESIE